MLLRIPPSLHEEVARAAAIERMSMNQYVLGVLAAVVSWKAKPADLRLDAWKEELMANFWNDALR